MLPEFVDIRKLKVIHTELQLFGQPDIGISHSRARFRIAGPDNAIDRIHILQEGSNAFKAISQLGADGVEVETAALLKVSELGNFKAVEHDLPADAPGAAGRPFPVILFKLEVVLAEVDADGLQRFEIQLLHVYG